ncbi:hypothetical protein RJ640_028084 [Escallonia rubra]|uniref:dTMP kinase n=1 Tax=Escallonia rubra TaxID=112253 RepID=A0AA88QQU3_9ASTE|nr:hypothetical protein RJ640_028084 [Escallonia rubra]
MDAANLFKPMLARGQLRCISATTLEEYRKYVEKDAAFERRFQQVVWSAEVDYTLFGGTVHFHVLKCNDPCLLSHYFQVSVSFFGSVIFAVYFVKLMKIRLSFLPDDFFFPQTRNYGVLAARRSLNLESDLKFRLKCFLRRIHMEKKNSSESRGALIVLEGLDRSGKTSQSTRLHSFLDGLGYSVESWRFPDRNTGVGQMISSYLANESQLDDRAIHLLFSANRWEKRRLSDKFAAFASSQAERAASRRASILQIQEELLGFGDDEIIGFLKRLDSHVKGEWAMKAAGISLMETKLRTGKTLIVDRYSYSGVAFSSAKGLDIEWCKAPEMGLLAPDLKAAERGGYGGERYEQLEFQRKVAKSYQTLRDSSWKTIDACCPVEDVEMQIREVVSDCVVTCEKGKSLSQLWSFKEQHGGICPPVLPVSSA